MWTLAMLFANAKTNHTEINGKWVPARPIVVFSWYRVKAAWAVLVGKADAFTWPEGQ